MFERSRMKNCFEGREKGLSSSDTLRLKINLHMKYLFLFETFQHSSTWLTFPHILAAHRVGGALKNFKFTYISLFPFSTLPHTHIESLKYLPHFRIGLWIPNCVLCLVIECEMWRLRVLLLLWGIWAILATLILDLREWNWIYFSVKSASLQHSIFRNSSNPRWESRE